MTPLEWIDEAISRHTILRLDKKIDRLVPGRSDYGRGTDYGQELSHEFFLHELRELKELLAPRPVITAKEVSCPSCGATSR